MQQANVKLYSAMETTMFNTKHANISAEANGKSIRTTHKDCVVGDPRFFALSWA